MYDLNQKLFYKTKFDIVCDESVEDALWTIIMMVKKWMCSKHRGAIEEGAPVWTKFKHGYAFDSDDGSVRFESAHFDEGDERCYCWACRITEEVFERNCAPRKWVTEIGLKGLGDVTEFSLVLSYGDRPGYIGLCQEKPKASIPKIVKWILQDARLQCSCSGLQVSMEPTLLKVGDFPMFWDAVRMPERDVPIIYVSPRLEGGKEGKTLIKPKKLAEQLGPSAIVYYSRSRDFSYEMRSMIESLNLRCENGTVRVYATRPRFEELGDWTRHRYFTSTQILDFGPAEILSMLRRALAQDMHFYESMMRIETVRDMKRLAVRKRREEESRELLKEEYLIQKSKTDEAAFDFMMECEEKRVEAEARSEVLQEELNKEREASFGLSQKMAVLEDALNLKSKRDSLDIATIPSSVNDVAQYFLLNYQDCLAFTERGIASLDDCRTSPAVFWNALYDLVNIAHPLFAGKKGVDFVKAFQGSSKFEYARGAGVNTRANKNLMRQYKDFFQGRELDVQHHIKKGSKPADETFVRIYFAYDALSGKLVVSSCVHLDNASTRTLS